MRKGGFERLARRYIAGECTPEEAAYVEKWVESHHRSEGDRHVFADEEEAERMSDDIWSRVLSESGLANTKWKSRGSLWFGWVTAASVALAVIVFWSWKGSQGDSESTSMAGVKTYNASVSDQRIILPDSSVVTLAAGAEMTTSEDFGAHTRTVRLKGAAFFDIRPNPKKPFLVYSGDLVTEVLGTSFEIKPVAGKNVIEVSVVSGKVSVYSTESKGDLRREGAILRANQKAVFQTETKLIRQDLVDVPKKVKDSPPPSAFKFEESTVGEVINVLQKSYGMEIVVSNPDLKQCLFTGDLDGFDLFKQLSYLCRVTGAKYEVRGTTLFVTGGRCATPTTIERK
jgi:transmembrane sensor